MPDYIKQLIAEGEHQKLDFKYEVSDFRKIARTLVAFSNTDGGRLLVGVKDNGSISGIRSEEEYFMIEGAARLYCKPEVNFSAREWNVDGKKVMEVLVKRGDHKPYTAQDDEGRWFSYIRQGDQNFKAARVVLAVWQRQKSGKPTTIHFRQAEQTLLSYLEQNSTVSTSKFRRLAGISVRQAEKTLVDFIMIGILKFEHSSTGIIFSLTKDYRFIIDELENNI